MSPTPSEELPINHDQELRDDSHSPQESAFDPDGNNNDANAPGRPGRKKNPNSQAARRDQNRIAQREFRLRKQQRIRDLEARVEILSGSREESYQEMRAIIMDLIKENATLRGLVKDMGDFVGAGEGGFIPKLGWTWEEFSNFVDRAETDTAFEGFLARRRAGADGSGSAAAGSGSQRRKRSADEPSQTARKKSRTDNACLDDLSKPGNGQMTNGTDSQIYPFSSAPSPSSPIWPGLQAMDQPNMLSNFLDPLKPDASPITNIVHSPFAPTGPPPPPPVSHNTYPNMSSGAQSFNGSGQESPQTPVSNVRPQSPLDTSREDGRANEEKLQEAIKLIKYHLDNYRRNAAYCLPPSLRPSLVQRTVPHESIIDELVNPELRDSLILHRARYDLVECLHLAASNLELHGEDVLAHPNWEFKEQWLRQYSFLVEQPLLNICNKWRKERGEPELALAEFKSAASL